MEEQQDRIQQLEQQVEQLTREKQRLEEKLNAALDGTGLCLWEQHVPTGRLRIFNMEWGKMLGFQPNELEANLDTWKSKLHPDDYDLAVGAFEDHLHGRADTYQVVHRMLHKDGSHSWVSDRGRIVEYAADGSPLRIMGTHIDITNEKRYEQELSRLARQDPLTNLLNRKALQSEFNRINHSKSDSLAAMVFIDVDNFKTVNDHLGHKAGDAVLVVVAEWLKRFAPPQSVIARLGGDEFVLLCEKEETQALNTFTDQLLTHAAEPVVLENGKAHIGFSIGVCEFVQGQHDFETLYERADEAMYQVKRSGKNGVRLVRA
ncbi:sensor domain-containing diguanylate cyclase [Vibrio fluvialis]|nr:sensor domain-containing diguanylate cyclase [Vibrio fluvialis]MBY7998815.1 sensor domain-containing diguanylate cyclase [Vibrio fluvialis]MBY8011140.1 sensor domain-containing diguanylate cyclase [Vibrio fluvialis]MBY8016136.1 sensor domain-containing diguanylate cyclase [Vibrio fluvialis]